MKERPILFSTPMVQAILDGRKTMTRRVIDFKKIAKKAGCSKGTLAYSNTFNSWAVVDGNGSADMCLVNCPYGQPGDRLWVRETFAVSSSGSIYRADTMLDSCTKGDISWKWKPSIFMPRWASRITLEITNVRVERLQDTSEDDARAEGVERFASGWKNYTDFAVVCQTARAAFRTLWESINGPGSWNANPWVWVVEFRRIET